MPFFTANTIPALRNRLRRQPLAVAGVLLLAAFVLGGLTAPWLAPANPAAIDLAHRLESPSVTHWAGTDELGRDTLSRLLYGARLSLAVSVTVVAISLALGLAVGGLAGYLGGWIDIALTTFAMNTFLALPGILLAIAFAAFLGPGFSNLVLALAIGGWAGYARLVRPSWGAMLNDARLHLFDSPHMVLFPAAAVAGAVLGFNFIGDALRDQLDPRTRLEMGL